MMAGSIGFLFFFIRNYVKRLYNIRILDGQNTKRRKPGLPDAVPQINTRENIGEFP
jgi:hypothetical protein